jgi:4-amino-4-deoxy-L-arabinose transferase-like glycosyltransferase
VLIGIWAAAYLLNLGSTELRSEEGHRVMPAVQMLESGNYLVPYVGTEPYLRKPPLVNWIVAASFKLFGVRNEWAARLPSASSS